MDLSSLVSTVVAVLAPFLPYLTKVGEPRGLVAALKPRWANGGFLLGGVMGL